MNQICSVQLLGTAVNEPLSRETSFTLLCETGSVVYVAYVVLCLAR